MMRRSPRRDSSRGILALLSPQVALLISTSLVAINTLALLYAANNVPFNFSDSATSLGLSTSIVRGKSLRKNAVHLADPDDVVAGDARALENDHTCVITISAWNNFGFVWNLYDSIVENSPSIGCFVWFIGDIPVHPDKESLLKTKRIKTIISSKKLFTAVTMADMKDFHPTDLAFKFDMKELQTTLKPFAFQYTFQKIGAKAAIYLDNDIWVTSPLLPLQLELQRRSAIVTPHITNPIPEDGMHQKYINILQAGVFNFGFVSFKNTPQAARFLEFWGQRLRLYDYVDLPKGMHFDQNWGMFIPAFFDHEAYLVIRDPRYNVAYWNLHYTGPNIHLDPQSGLPHLGDQPTVFVHFSGMSLLEEYDMFGISMHQNRYTLDDFPRLEGVLKAYLTKLEMHDALTFRAIPYGYNYFSDGTTAIGAEMRRAYASAVYSNSGGGKDELSAEEDGSSIYGHSLTTYDRVAYAKHVMDDPFCIDAFSCQSYVGFLSGLWYDSGKDPKMTFLEWYMKHISKSVVDMEGLFFYSSLEHDVWMKRGDLQTAFPDPAGDSFVQFKNWFMKNSVNEKQVNKNTYVKWHDLRKDQASNHLKYHKRVKTAEDIGSNIIGWHGGKFSIGIIADKLRAAARSVSLNFNAIQLPYLENKKFSHPLNYDLTRSPSEMVNIVAATADSTPVFIDSIPSVVRRNKYNIGYWAWELDVFPAKWLQHLKAYDEIWCLSTFIKNSIETTRGYDGTPVKVLNLPLLDEEARHTTNSMKSLPNELNLKSSTVTPFVFLVVFDFHSYPARKNPTAATKAFLTAFPKKKDPMHKYQLIVKAHSGTESQMDNLRKEANNDSRITFIFRVLNDAENIALRMYQDCYVSLHRSEGYGLNILESMGAGIPVIATNYSGNVDFFGVSPSYFPQCHYPIPFKMIELEEDYGPYKAGNHWAEPDHESAVKAMRTVVGQNCKFDHGKSISRVVFDQFGQNAIGKKMRDLLAESLPDILQKQVQISRNELSIEASLEN